MGPFWKRLNDDSKRFLTTGELIFNSLKEFKATFKSQDIDFSPVVLQFSKALEKELLLKVFEKAKNNKLNIDNKYYQSYKNGELDLTLGQMSYILKEIKKKNLSPIFNHILIDVPYFFNDFNFPKKLEKFIFRFRNKSAHTTPLTEEDCMECKKYLLKEPIKLLILLEENLF